MNYQELKEILNKNDVTTFEAKVGCAKSEGGQPYIMSAAMAGADKVVAFLVEKCKIDPNFSNWDEKCSPLYYTAAKVGMEEGFGKAHLNTINYLISVGANVQNLSDSWGNNAIHFLSKDACLNGNLNAKEALDSIVNKCPNEEFLRDGLGLTLRDAAFLHNTSCNQFVQEVLDHYNDLCIHHHGDLNTPIHHEL